MASLNVSRPFLSAAELQAISRVFDSGYLGMGSEVEGFERELERYLGNSRVVRCVNTGTSALHLALEALELPSGSEVLVPTLTYVATFHAVKMAGMVPVACDVETANGTIDLRDVERRITSRTRVIMPVHYASNVGELNDLYRLADRHGLRVIEDAAHAFGCEIDAVRVGACGDIVCFSFDPIKNITAIEGGAIVSADRDFQDKVTTMRLLGIEGRADNRVPLPYDVQGSGWRYHMSDVNAAVGRVQLARFESELKPARVTILSAYRHALKDVTEVRLITGKAGVVPHIVVIAVAAEARAVVQKNLLTAGFDSRVHYIPNHLHSLFRTEYELPNAEALYSQVISLPCHPEVTVSDVVSICDVVRASVSEPRRSGAS